MVYFNEWKFIFSISSSLPQKRNEKILFLTYIYLHIYVYFSDFRSYDCFAKHRTLRVTIISMRTSF